MNMVKCPGAEHSVINGMNYRLGPCRRGKVYTWSAHYCSKCAVMHKTSAGWSTCPTCHGENYLPDPCPRCRGEGRYYSELPDSGDTDGTWVRCLCQTVLA